MQSGPIRIEPADHRRNLTVRGVPLNHLVGRRFRVGEVILRGGRLNFPCKYLEELLGLPVYLPLYNRSGLNCAIERGGTIRPGDEIELLDQVALDPKPSWTWRFERTPHHEAPRRERGAHDARRAAFSRWCTRSAPNCRNGHRGRMSICASPTDAYGNIHCAAIQPIARATTSPSSASMPGAAARFGHTPVSRSARSPTCRRPATTSRWQRMRELTFSSPAASGSRRSSR